MCSDCEVHTLEKAQNFKVCMYNWYGMGLKLDPIANQVYWL